MIKPIEMFACYCDNCGRRWEDQDNGYVAFTDKSSMQSVLLDDCSWHYEYANEKHYCEKCFGGFDDDDNIILTASIPIPPNYKKLKNQ